jgi:hypothetical protein
MTLVQGNERTLLLKTRHPRLTRLVVLLQCIFAVALTWVGTSGNMAKSGGIHEGETAALPAAADPVEAAYIFEG